MTRPTLILALWTALTLLAACDVHEFPQLTEEPVEEEVLPNTLALTLEHATDWDTYTEVTYSLTRATNFRPRHIVNVYQPESDGSYGRTPSATYTFEGNADGTLDQTVQIDFDEEGDYKFIVWTDYTTSGSTDDYYYDTSSFAAITLTDLYEGNTEYRDAFYGEVEVSIAEGDNSATVSLSRPLAQFVFISTDLDEFITRVIARNTTTDTRDDDDTSTKSDGDVDMRSIDLSVYTVVLAYTSYMPNSFNIFTNRPADSITGMSFYGGLTQISDTEATMGFDYVLVGTSATSVQVALYVFDEDALQIASTNVITVPLLRSCITTVRGEFLTSDADSGVGIDPSFEGSFDILID